MAEIFLSHASRDKDAVQALHARLLAGGFDVYVDWGARDETGQLASNLMSALQACRLVICCVSDHQRASAWCAEEQTLAYGYDKPVVFVQLGPLTGDFRAKLALAASAYALDLTDAKLAEGNYQRLLQTLATRLGQPAPIVVQAMLLAVDQQRFGQLFDAQEAQPSEGWADVKRLCAEVGMGDGDALRTELARRYGPTADDYRPFDDVPLKARVRRALGLVNVGRARRQLPRLHIRWREAELLAGDRQAYRDWSAGPSLAIVDSISAFDPQLSSGVVAFVREPDSANISLGWIPPHTRRTSSLSTHRDAAASAKAQIWYWLDRRMLLDQELRGGDGDPPMGSREVQIAEHLVRHFVLDAGEPVALQQWLHGVMSSLGSGPIDRNIDSFFGGEGGPPAGPRGGPRGFFGGMP